MKVAFVHDYLNQCGGAERVLEALHSVFPDAPVYTLFYDRKRMPDHFQKWDIRESFLRKFPFIRSQYEKYFFVMPLAIESFDLSEFDLVISISSAWSKGVITLPKTVHINYMLNPMRFAWNSYQPLVKARSGLKKIMLFLGLHHVRQWDENTSKRADMVVTISKTVEKRIEKFYGINPVIIYPPVDTVFFTPDNRIKKGDFFLIVSRLRPYKRIDIAVDVFNEVKLPLLIVGEGSLRGDLERKANRNIQFLGKRTDEEIRSLYRRAKAVIFPTFEDFGIVPLEANACGTPVIAFGAGGATETIEEGKNGLFFYPQTKEALMEIVLNFSSSDFSVESARAVALKFSLKNFLDNFGRIIDKVSKKKK